MTRKQAGAAAAAAAFVLAASPLRASAAQDIRDASVSGYGYEAGYTGGEIEFPSLAVEMDGERLKKGRDFTVSYRDNVGPGTAAAVIKGKGGYTGTVEIYFDITTPEAAQDSSDGSADMSAAVQENAAEAADARETDSTAMQDAAGEGQAQAQIERAETEPTAEGAQQEPSSQNEGAEAEEQQTATEQSPLTGDTIAPYGRAGAVFLASAAAVSAAALAGRRRRDG